MNFLAHLYLSGKNEKIMIGNFIGDFVKGKAYEQYETDIQKGILLHREIDNYTDSHLIVMRSKERLRPKYHHYAPVITDVFYDHFLSSLWQNYHHEPLENFTTYFYQLADKYHSIIPKTANHMLTYMKRDNWLLNYQYVSGIDRALTGMARRTPYVSKMDQAAKDLEENYDLFREDFRAFFPELQHHVRNFKHIK